MPDDNELATIGPIPTVNPNVAKIGDFLDAAKKFANQYYVKDYVPLIGGTQLGDVLLGKAPEEVQRWGQGDYPFRNPSEVTGTGGNRLDIWKTGRFEPSFDVANTALMAAPLATKAAKLTKGLPVGMSIQDVSKETGNIVKSEPDEMGFHSALENAIHKIQQPKGTGDQILKQLEKTPGVKIEELNVTGLKDFLKSKLSVTKQEVADYIKENRLKLNEHILGSEENGVSPDDYRLQGGDVYHDQDYIDSLAEDLHHDMVNDPDIYHQEKEAIKKQFPEEYAGHETDPEIDAALHQHVKDSLSAQAKQSSHDMYYENPIHHYYDDFGYDVYGNDDSGYSIKTPNGRFLDLSNGHGLYDISDVESALAQHHMEEGNLDLHNDGAKYEDYTLPGPYNEYREVLTTYPTQPPVIKQVSGGYWVASDGPGSEPIIEKSKEEAIERWRRSRSVNNFTSNHYDQPNIVGHLRLNDRNINGKRTLMVEEVQSDWHQAGRKKGYIKPLDKDEAFDLSRQYDSLQKDKRLLGEKRDEAEAAGNMVQKLDYINQIDEISKKQYEISQKLNGNNGVPDAPFKKNWHEMLMKQALDIAAKGDYEGVAFTTGKQQAERYNLRKHLDEIYYKKNNDGTYTVSAIDKNHRSHMGNSYTPEQIEEHLGKEMVRKIVNDEGKTIERSDSKSISGEGLEIGGEGMKGFYDKILPDFVNKYGKKWGIAVKKANLEHSGGSLRTEDIEEGIKNQGYTMDQYRQLPANEKMKIFNKIAGEEVHYFDMPEAAKKDIMENGQPLFAGIGLAGVPIMGPDDQKKHGILKDIAKLKK